MRPSTIQTLARAGLVAKGIVYLVIGVLAAMWAFGQGGEVTGGEGAIYSLADMTGGSLALTLLGIGLAAYAFFQLFQAATNPGNDNAGKRIGRLVSGVGHVVLAFTCFQALGFASSSGSSKKTYLAQILASDGGRWLAVIAGVGIIAAAAYQLYKAWDNAPAEQLAVSEMSRSAREWTIKLGRFGLAARGVVFGIIGIALVKAGLAADSSQAKTTGGALREVSQAGYGVISLAIVALGLAAYGVYTIASARYRRIAV